MQKISLAHIGIVALVALGCEPAAEVADAVR